MILVDLVELAVCLKLVERLEIIDFCIIVEHRWLMCLLLKVLPSIIASVWVVVALWEVCG